MRLAEQMLRLDWNIKIFGTDTGVGLLWTVTFSKDIVDEDGYTVKIDYVNTIREPLPAAICDAARKAMEAHRD